MCILKANPGRIQAPSLNPAEMARLTRKVVPETQLAEYNLLLFACRKYLTCADGRNQKSKIPMISAGETRYAQHAGKGEKVDAGMSPIHKPHRKSRLDTTVLAFEIPGEKLQKRNRLAIYCGIIACRISCPNTFPGTECTSQEHDDHTPSSLLPQPVEEQQNIVLHNATRFGTKETRTVTHFFVSRFRPRYVQDESVVVHRGHLALKDVPWWYNPGDSNPSHQP